MKVISTFPLTNIPQPFISENTSCIYSSLYILQMCNLANEKSGVLHLGNTQMHINKYTIVHINKYTPVQLTNAQLRTTLTNKKLPSNFSRPDISVVVMTSQGEDQILSKELAVKSFEFAIRYSFYKWVRQYSVVS